MTSKTRESIEMLENLTTLVTTEAGKEALDRIKGAMEVTDIEKFQADRDWADAWFKNNLPGLHPDELEGKEPTIDMMVNALLTFKYVNDEYVKAVNKLSTFTCWENLNSEEKTALEELTLVLFSYIVVAILDDYNSTEFTEFPILESLEKCFSLF